MEIHVHARALRCALCHDEAYGALCRCASCGTLLHHECAAEIRICPTLGCRRGMRVMSLRAEPAPAASESWLRLLFWSNPLHGAFSAFWVLLIGIGLAEAVRQGWSTAGARPFDQRVRQARSSAVEFIARTGRAPDSFVELDHWPAPRGARSELLLPAPDGRLFVLWEEEEEHWQGFFLARVTSSDQIAEVTSAE